MRLITLAVTAILAWVGVTPAQSLGLVSVAFYDVSDGYTVSQFPPGSMYVPWDLPEEHSWFELFGSFTKNATGGGWTYDVKVEVKVTYTNINNTSQTFNTGWRNVVDPGQDLTGCLYTDWWSLKDFITWAGQPADYLPTKFEVKLFQMFNGNYVQIDSQTVNVIYY